MYVFFVVNMYVFVHISISLLFSNAHCAQCTTFNVFELYTSSKYVQDVLIYYISRSSTLVELHNLLMVLSRHANEVLMVCLLIYTATKIQNIQHTMIAFCSLNNIYIENWKFAWYTSILVWRCINLVDFSFNLKIPVSVSNISNKQKN